MTEFEKISISKLDAACRQLDCAIELWFADGDPVSIHTLACASHQIIHDIKKLGQIYLTVERNREEEPRQSGNLSKIANYISTAQ